MIRQMCRVIIKEHLVGIEFYLKGLRIDPINLDWLRLIVKEYFSNYFTQIIRILKTTIF
jgi:hypothetical protein